MPFKNREKRLEYSKEYNKEWYKKNKDKRHKQIKARKQEIKKFILEIKTKLKCNRCSESANVCLVFHHIDQKKKEISISEASNQGWSKKRILKEIEKCEILCANCHRKEHDKQRKEKSVGIQVG